MRSLHHHHSPPRPTHYLQGKGPRHLDLRKPFLYRRGGGSAKGGAVVNSVNCGGLFILWKEWQNKCRREVLVRVELCVMKMTKTAACIFYPAILICARCLVKLYAQSENLRMNESNQSRKRECNWRGLDSTTRHATTLETHLLGGALRACRAWLRPHLLVLLGHPSLLVVRDLVFGHGCSYDDGRFVQSK